MALPNSWFDEMKLVNMTKIKTGILPCYYEIWQPRTIRS